MGIEALGQASQLGRDPQSPTHHGQAEVQMPVSVEEASTQLLQREIGRQP
jgi:hypothetical protein